MYKGEEENRPTLSYIMHAIETEIQTLTENFIEIEQDISIPNHVVKNHEDIQRTEADDEVMEIEESSGETQVW